MIHKKIVKDIDGRVDVEIDSSDAQSGHALESTSHSSDASIALELDSSDAQSGHALKFDTDKVRMELLSVDFLTEVSKVLTFGAAKYTKIQEKELRQWLLQYDVHIQIGKYRQGGYVVRVMNPGSRRTPQNTERRSLSTSETIGNGIRKDSQSMIDSDDLLNHEQKHRSVEHDVPPSNESSESHWSNGIGYWQNKMEPVLYVPGQPIDTTQTTVMPADASGESFVLGATTASGTLTILSKVLNEQWNILGTLNEFIETGSHNWRKGFDWSRLYGAALRHLTAHMNGVNLDEESGLSHLSHAACCLMFLVEHEVRGLGSDDRHVHVTQLVEREEHEVDAETGMDYRGYSVEEIAKKMREASDAHWAVDRNRPVLPKNSSIEDSRDTECVSCGATVEEGTE